MTDTKKLQAVAAEMRSWRSHAGFMSARLVEWADRIDAATGGEHGDREADRRRFNDSAFNDWLDQGISDCGHTVWQAITDVASAWEGWEAARAICRPEARGVEGMVLVPVETLQTAIDRARVFDDGGNGADPESARSVVALLTSMLATPNPVRAEQRKLQAWVGDMKTSAGMDYYVCVGYSAARGDYLTPHSHKNRGRAEYDVAKWNHLLGNGPEPDILAFDTDPFAEQPEGEGKGADGIDTTMFRPEWRRDCQGKADYDTELVSLSCRYYPVNYRADNKHSVNASIVCDPAQHTFVSREFSADTQAGAKKLAEEWARGQITFITIVLTKAFAEQGEQQ